MLAVRGDQLLAESRSAGAGMLVMGAYIENCERESIFGGNSQVATAKWQQPSGNSQVAFPEADLPVVLVH